MRKLQDYTREELLALVAGEELDGLVINLLGGGSWVKGEGPSENMEYVGAMLSYVAEIDAYSGVHPSKVPDGLFWVCHLSASNVGLRRETLPHVCALALVLAAWEKAKREENNQ